MGKSQEQIKAIKAKDPAMRKALETQHLLAKTSGKMGMTKAEIKALKEKDKEMKK